MEIDLTRPSKLYRYLEKKWLERSLDFGEFRLRPASDYKKHEIDLARHDDELVRINKSPASAVTITIEGSGQQIKPIGDVTYRSEVGTNYLTICFSERWDELLFNDFPGTDACLVVHDVDQFSERFHAAAELALPEWAGIDGPVVYGGRSKLGPVFSKPLHFIIQHEWRFAWHPSKPKPIEHIAITICIGSIANIAEVIERPNHESPST